MTNQPDDYYSHSRSELLPYILKHSPTRVLDVGCGEGGLGRGLKEEGVPYVEGIEINPYAYDKASEVLDLTWMQSAENQHLFVSREGDWKFDVVVFADILEHLREPWDVLKAAREWLRPGGRVVISVPNVGNIHTLLNLTQQRWKLSDAGVMDRTHLRWFCREDLREMVGEAGYEVEVLEGLWFDPPPGIEPEDFNNRIPEGTFGNFTIGREDNPTMAVLARMDQDRLQQLYTPQYVCVGRV